MLLSDLRRLKIDVIGWSNTIKLLLIGWLQEAKLEASANQQLCTLGSLAGESQNMTTDTNVTQSEQQTTQNDPIQKVCYYYYLLNISSSEDPAVKSKVEQFQIAMCLFPTL